MLLLPRLSEYDPALDSEGSLDPLGLYPIADSLGVRLVPGVRERQGYPRFLTAMAVVAIVCEPFDEDSLASDETSPPWQVMEWYIVEGLVRAVRDNGEIRGLPGRDKARTVIKDGLTLSADRYLKSPAVFGFHGVYRLLAKALRVEDSGFLGDFDYELASAWAEEQGLDGFVNGSGEGALWRKKLFDAVKDGMQLGSVARSPGWAGWRFFGDYLAPHDIGKREGGLIGRALLDTTDGYRGVVLEHLVSDEGKSILKDDDSERAFHDFLVERVDGELRELVTTVKAYETFSRLMEDAFDDCRYLMSQRFGKAHVRELAGCVGVTRAADTIYEVSRELSERLEPFDESARFELNFGWTTEPMPARQWVERLFSHHESNQRRKPPSGKAPWIEQLDSGQYLLRTPYRIENGGRLDDSYVHRYRTGSLWSFAQDLGWV